MKKYIAFILSICLCLSMMACVYTDDTPTSSTGTTENPYANHPHLPYLFGQWELQPKESYNQNEQIPCSKITINEDGSCIADDANGTWSISKETDDRFLIIDIYIDNVHRFCVGYYEADSAIGVWSANYHDYVDRSWHNTSLEQTITLTTENFRDFFNLSTVPKYEFNEADELVSMTLHQYLVLKDEYAGKIVFQDVTVEFCVIANRCEVSLDDVNIDYFLGDIVEELVTSSAIKPMEKHNGSYRIELFENNCINAAENADPNSNESKTILLTTSISKVIIEEIKGTITITGN